MIAGYFGLGANANAVKTDPHMNQASPRFTFALGRPHISLSKTYVSQLNAVIMTYDRERPAIPVTKNHEHWDTIIILSVATLRRIGRKP